MPWRAVAKISSIALCVALAGWALSSLHKIGLRVSEANPVPTATIAVSSEADVPVGNRAAITDASKTEPLAIEAPVGTVSNSDSQPFADRDILRDIDRLLGQAPPAPFRPIDLSTSPGALTAAGPFETPGDEMLLPDLYVESLSALIISSGEEADITVTVTNAAETGAVLNGVQVDFYAGNPLSGGVRVGPNLVLDLPVGESVTRNVSLSGIGGAREVFVVVDANDGVAETNELNNVNHVMVSTKLPYAGVDDYPPVRLK
ncbi:MAG: CARDB domain-containing protein [Verrucomicrobiales bacterium]